MLDNAKYRSARKRSTTQLAEFAYVNGKLFAETPAAGRFRTRRCAALLLTSVRPRLEPHQPSHLWLDVPIGDGREGATQPRRALHQRKEHPQTDWSAVPRRPSKTELARIGNHEGKTSKGFHVKLATLRFLDPACGCGNFLVLAYRELRLLEIEVLRRLYDRQGVSAQPCW